ncbi:unnamed protein product [Diamesa serratosioi]
MKTESTENLVNSNSSLDLELAQESREDADGVDDEGNEFDFAPEIVLTPIEKKFLLSAERGDLASVRKLIEDYRDKPEELEINCVDPLERSALIAAIENENIELIRLLLEEGIKVKDALLHAIKEEYVEAVETLLIWEEEHHIPGEPYSWESVDRSSSSFTQDITPLILAAHKNNYEILKILLDRGASLPMPHDVRCGCDECLFSSENDSLRHSQSRINAYKALSASSLIALSSRDPILTAFELSWELRRLSRMETEFRAEYNVMRKNCQEFATALLDHARTSNELEIMLNYNPTGENWEPGERQTLERLKLAIKYKQKMFVAHPNVQQLLAAIWYEGLPGFRRKGIVGQAIQVGKLAASFPLYCTVYMLAPDSEMGKFMKKPFVKFIVHSASYAFFLTLLGAASQRVEFLLLEWFGNPWVHALLDEWKKHERGALPGIAESACMIYIISLVWGEMRSLFADGLMDYISDLWNIVDFISNSFYVAWISLRFTSWFVVQRDAARGLNPWYPREEWGPYDPMLLSEGAFAAGMVFSFLKLVHIFSINPHLGPLQVSLGRMIIDIIKFFFIYTLVLFAFGCGLNQLMWYYADLEKNKCYHLPSGLPDFDNNEKACAIWRRFSNLFETSQSLFWASFGLVDLMAFELTGIKSFTRFWALLMFGSYSVINIIVLLNMLIAMMSNSYQIIYERSDTEWKFARSHLWISYFDDGATLPPPFNLFPTVKLVRFGKNKNSTTSVIKRSRDKAKRRHDNVMKLLVRRYVCDEQRKRDDFGITEDDVMEIRQDISTLRYELIDIFSMNQMKTPKVNKDESVAGKKGKMMERRILKDFQIGIVEGILNASMQTAKEPKDVFSTIAKVIGKRSSSKIKNEDWNAAVRKSTIHRNPIGSKSQALERQRSRQSLRRHILECQGAGLSMNTENLLQYNPKLADVSKSTRIAYAKFMTAKIKKEIHFEDGRVRSETEVREKAQATRAFNRFKMNAGILKKSVYPPDPEPEPIMEQTNVQSIEASLSENIGDPPDEVISVEDFRERKDFRSRTPIEEDPDEDLISTYSPSTPEPFPSTSPNQSTSPDLTLNASPSPPLIPLIPEIVMSPPKSPKVDSPMPKLRSNSNTSESRTPSSESNIAEESDKDEEDEESKDVKEEPKAESAQLNVPNTENAPSSPSFSISGSDKGKSKITGKTLTGWL